MWPLLAVSAQQTARRAARPPPPPPKGGPTIRENSFTQKASLGVGLMWPLAISAAQMRLPQPAPPPPKAGKRSSPSEPSLV
ncbi:unnamed protein product [Withania somnifera]